jgi:hypothetical protein
MLAWQQAKIKMTDFLDEVQTPHSILGASSAERWMKCPGSIKLLSLLGLPDSDEAEYRKEGIASHEAAAILLRDDAEAWTIVGERFYGHCIDADQADAIQTYLSYVGSLPTGTSWIEASVGATRSGEVPREFYGTVDHARLAGDTLYVTDYKNGEGLVVEAYRNPQIMYYALAFLLTMPGLEQVKKIVLTIVQPRAFHPDGPIRSWETTPEEVLNWGDEELFPAMALTEVDDTLTPGEWCRFCPAKLVCPMMTALFGAAAKANPQAATNMTDDRLGAEYKQIDAVKFYIMAVEQEALRRRMEGHSVPGTKLVLKKANRVWKPGAPKLLVQKLGDNAMTKPEIKSPAEISKLGKDAKALVAEYAYTPETGYTLARPGDQRLEVKVSRPSDEWGGSLDKLVGDPQISEIGQATDK